MGGIFLCDGSTKKRRCFWVGRDRRKKPQASPKRKRRTSRPDCVLHQGSGRTIIWWSSELSVDCLGVLQVRFGCDLRVRGLYPENESFIEDYLDFVRQESEHAPFVVLPLDVEASLTNQLRPTVTEMKRLGLEGFIALVKNGEILEIDRVVAEVGWYQDWINPQVSMKASRPEEGVTGLEYRQQSVVPLNLAQALRRAS